MRKLKKINGKNVEILFFLLFLTLIIFLRLWNLKNWWLIDSDEIHMISFLKEPSSSFGSPTSTYFPTLILAKLFFFIDSFPEIRYVTAIPNILGIFFIFLATKTFLPKNKKSYAFIPPLLIGTNGFILYATRRFTVDALDIAIISLILYLIFLWRKSKNNVYIPFIFILSALGINNHGITIYFVAPLFMWSIYLFIKRKINFKIIFFSGISFLLMMIPYINILINADHSAYVLEKYSGTGINTAHLINFIRPNFFIESLYQLFTIPELWSIMSSMPMPIIIRSSLMLPLIFIILILPLLIYFYNKHSDKDLNFLIWYSYGIILFMLFSPIPGTTGHFIPFFIVFSCLLTKELNLKQKSAKLILIPIILIIFFNFLFTYQIITKNSYDELNKLWPRDSKKITIDFFSYKTLNMTQPSVLKSAEEFNIFECRSDGIYSYDNSHATYDPNFFKEQKFIESDLVILHTVSPCKYYNIFSVNDLPLKSIGRVNEIVFYEKT